MFGKSLEFEDVARVASSFPTYPGKIYATLLAEYVIGDTKRFQLQNSKWLPEENTGTHAMLK